MILWMSRKQRQEHDNMRHSGKHQGCSGACAWGFSNPKHHPHSGGVGAPARRKALAISMKYRRSEAKAKAGGESFRPVK